MMFLLLLGCSDEGAPSWAFQHASVSVDEDGVLRGFQVWELYAARWSKKQKEKHHLCAYIQELFGTPLQSPDCPDCTGGYRASAVSADTDCATDWRADIDASTAEFELLIGASLAEDDVTATLSGPHQGWYQRFGEGEVLPQGHIWSDSGSSDALPSLVTGELYLLWSTSAWQLTEE